MQSAEHDKQNSTSSIAARPCKERKDGAPAVPDRERKRGKPGHSPTEATMNRKILSLWIMPQFLCLVLVWPCYGQSDDLDQKLGISVHGYTLSADCFADGLLQLADRFQIPMGIEWISSRSTRSKLAMGRTDGSVREIFQKVVETQPGYEMRISNGVVRVVATTVSPNENFLLIRIKSFNIRNELVESAQQKLRELVRASVILPKPGGGGVAGSLTSNVGEPKIDVSITDATVGDVLDALATSSPTKVWVVTFAESAALTPTGFRRTESLHGSVPVSDDEQPIWQTFRWGAPRIP